MCHGIGVISVPGGRVMVGTKVANRVMRWSGFSSAVAAAAMSPSAPRGSLRTTVVNQAGVDVCTY